MKRALREVVVCREGTEGEAPGYGQEGVLYVTDRAELAAALAEKGLPVLGILNENGRDASFGKTRFLAEQGQDLTEDYLERVYRRYAGLPWEILETERCILRETVEEDVEAFYRIYEEPSITRCMEPLFPDPEEERNYIRRYRENMYEFYGFGIWTALLKETGEIIGRAGLDMRAGFETPELGFVIGVPWQGRGLAGELCAAILRYGKEELGITRVQAMAEPENAVSLWLLEKLGFQKSGEYHEGGKRYFLLQLLSSASEIRAL